MKIITKKIQRNRCCKKMG